MAKLRVHNIFQQMRKGTKYRKINSKSEKKKKKNNKPAYSK